MKPADPTQLGDRSVEGLLLAVRREHIDQMHYVSCWDTSMPGVGGMDPVFITLKPGVAFDLQHGSHVDSTGASPP